MGSGITAVLHIIDSDDGDDYIIIVINKELICLFD